MDISKVEQYKCKSIYNGETDKVEDCTCGKCQDIIDKSVIDKKKEMAKKCRRN